MIKNYRLNKNYTQKELAKIIGIDKRTLQRIENHETKPKLEIFKKLIEELDIKDKDIINYIKK